MEEPQKILEELKGVRPEKLTGEAKRLFEAIMKIADERDELLKERQADKEKIKELESDNYECNNIIVRYMEELEFKDKMIELYIEHIYKSCDFGNRIKTKEQIKQYFENKAKVNLQSNKKNVDTEDFKQKYQCEWNLKSNEESGEIDEG